MTRDEKIENLFRCGWSLERIGLKYGISRQRVQQITKRRGLSKDDGGVTPLREQKREENRKKREILRDKCCLDKYGCNYKEYRRLLDAGVVVAFRQQRANAGLRKIPWCLTLWEWWIIWRQSGQWQKRGRNRGEYCMCRFGDKGPYSVENVYIDLHAKNTSYGWETRRQKAA